MDSIELACVKIVNEPFPPGAIEAGLFSPWLNDRKMKLCPRLFPLLSLSNLSDDHSQLTIRVQTPPHPKVHHSAYSTVIGFVVLKRTLEEATIFVNSLFGLSCTTV